MTLIRWMTLLAEASNLISMILLLVSFRKASLSARIILLHVILLFACNTSASYLASQRMNNFFLLHILTFFDLIFVSALYYTILEFGPNLKKLLLFVFGSILAFCLVDSFLISSVKTTNTYSVTLAGTFKVVLAIFYFISHLQKMASDEAHMAPKREIDLWHTFSVSLLIYTSSSILFFLFLDIMFQADIFDFFLRMNGTFYALSSVILLYGVVRYTVSRNLSD